jgi:hypothetical protein
LANFYHDPIEHFPGVHSIQIETNHLPNGMYWVQINQEKDSAYTQKIVVENAAH